MFRELGLILGIPGFPRLQIHVCQGVLKVLIKIISAVIRALRLKICFKIWDCFGGYQDFPSYKFMYVTVLLMFPLTLLVLGSCARKYEERNFAFWTWGQKILEIRTVRLLTQQHVRI